MSFESELVEYLFGGGVANDFNIYAAPRQPGPEPVLNAVSIEKDLERFAPLLERTARLLAAERRLWFDPPPIVVPEPRFLTSYRLAMPAPAGCRIILTE